MVAGDRRRPARSSSNSDMAPPRARRTRPSIRREHSLRDRSRSETELVRPSGGCRRSSIAVVRRSRAAASASASRQVAPSPGLSRRQALLVLAQGSSQRDIRVAGNLKQGRNVSAESRARRVATNPSYTVSWLPSQPSLP
jgi:hypothetical protein